MIAALMNWACSGDRLVAARGELKATPDPLTFAAVSPGASVTAPLQVTNQSGGKLVLVLEASPPYSVEPQTLSLEDGQQLTVDVRFSPLTGGPQPSQLKLVSSTFQTLVSLQGVATCVASSACVGTRLDPIRGCVDAPLANGTACTDACLSNAQCQNGLCKGEVLSCDDGNACTTDACGLTGCQHLSCLAPLDPCQIASCEASGCVTHPADDGTSCGPRDCTAARICLAGACVSAVPPEGTACDSLCGNGQCHAGHCDNATLALPARWSYQTAPNHQLNSTLALDAPGNLYWTESVYGPVNTRELVSVTRDGAPRFRSPLSTWNPTGRMPLFVDDPTGIVVTAQSGGTLGAWRLSSGASVWSHAVIGDYFAAAEVRPAISSFLIAMVNLGSGTAVAEFLLYPPEMGGVGSPSGTALVAFDLATGTRLWKHLSAGITSSLVADEHGNFYSLSSGPASKVESRNRLGALRWQTPVSGTGPSAPSAAFGGRLYLGHGDTLDTQTGQAVAGPPIAAGEAQVFNFSDLKYLQGSWLVTPTLALFEVGQYAGLRAIDPATRQVKWSDPRGIYEPIADPAEVIALLDDGSVLMIDLTEQWALTHVDATGHRADVCPLLLDRNIVYGPTGMVLQGGRLFISAQHQNATGGVYAFDVPNAALPRHGWVLARGDVNQGGAPR